MRTACPLRAVPDLQEKTGFWGITFWGRGDTVRVMGINFARAPFTTPAAYRHYLKEVIGSVLGKSEGLAVLPGLSDLYLSYRFGHVTQTGGLNRVIRDFLTLSAANRQALAELHSDVARELSCWLVPGTTLTIDDGHIYHEARLLTPQGETAGVQRQVFLSRRERELGLSRGEDLFVFTTGKARLGIIVGTDAFYSETGRILTGKGADLICHCGALPAGNNIWLQRTGMWQQVQQNQFFCVESQLAAELAGDDFYAESLVHAPCEMTDGFTGILARGVLDGSPLSAVLDYTARQQVIQNYPLLKLLNPAAYDPLSCERGLAP